jgi:hypothetical protein
MDAVEKRKISCLYQESNPDPSAVPARGLSLYHVMVNKLEIETLNCKCSK